MVLLDSSVVLNAVPQPEMGTASGINQMAQRLGTVFAIAISSAVFSAHGSLASPAAVTAGFRPALWTCVVFAALAAATAARITPRQPTTAAATRPAGIPASRPDALESTRPGRQLTAR